MKILLDGTRQQAKFFIEMQKIVNKEIRLGIPLLQIEEAPYGFMCAGGTVFREGLTIANR